MAIEANLESRLTLDKTEFDRSISEVPAEVGQAAQQAARSWSPLQSSLRAVGRSLANVDNAVNLNRLAQGASVVSSLTTALANSGAAARAVRTALSRVGRVSLRSLRQTISNNRRAIITLGAAATAAAGAFVAFRTARAALRGVGSAARSARTAVRGLQTTVSGFSGGALLPVMGGIAALALPIAAGLKSINEAADFETIQVGFEVILGSAEKAQARLEELTEFAATTPFQLTNIANASRTLEVLTQGALSTGDNLRLLGDVAAGTNQPIQELAVWFGRLYDGLNSGRPVGEALARLQELGIITGATRAKVEELSGTAEGGAKAWEAIAESFTRFGGSMARQSQTVNGLISTLRDNIDAVFRSVGQPVNNLFIKPAIEESIRLVNSLVPKIDEIGQAFQRAAQNGNLGGFVADSIRLGVLEGIEFVSQQIPALAFRIGSDLGEALGSLGSFNLGDAIVSALGPELVAAIAGGVNVIGIQLEIVATNFKALLIDALQAFGVGVLEIGSDISREIPFVGESVARGFEQTGKDFIRDTRLSADIINDRLEGLKTGLVEESEAFVSNLEQGGEALRQKLRDISSAQDNGSTGVFLGPSGFSALLDASEQAKKNLETGGEALGKAATALEEKTKAAVEKLSSQILQLGDAATQGASTTFGFLSQANNQVAPQQQRSAAILSLVNGSGDQQLSEISRMAETRNRLIEQQGEAIQSLTDTVENALIVE